VRDKIFHLPDFGEGLPDAEIVQWHVAIGDKVVPEQPLVSIETAKAVIDIPSPRPGRIRRLYGKPGDILATGSPLVEFDEGAEARKDPGTVVGKLTAFKREDTGRADTPQPPTPRVKATPAVRALAKRLRVDLSRVAPSGPEGSITTADVQRAAPTLQSILSLEPLRGARRAMAHRMATVGVGAIPVTLHEDADIDGWTSAKNTMLRLVRAVIIACRCEPSLNAWYDGPAIARKVLQEIHLGIAVDTEDGLFVPVLRDIKHRSVDSLAKELETLVDKVKTRTIRLEEMREYTLIVSNFGSIGGRYANPVLLPPTVATLGVGRMRPSVVPYHGQPVIHHMLPLSLTFDHRAVTGGEAARFLLHAIKDLQSPD
jgi:2-oxoisovalerate dehydrogenase E2 component (dihydrolipoyl transacylase)